MKRILSALLTALLICTLAACSNQPVNPTEPSVSPPTTSDPAGTPDTSTPPESTMEPTLERGPYAAMDIFSDEFNPYGMDWPFTVFEASFNKGSDKFDEKACFVLSMTGEGNMYACIAYQADVAGLGLDEDGKFALLNEYLANGGFCEFEGADGRIVTIRHAIPDDNRYEYVEADGSHGASGAGCVIDITFYVDEAAEEKYTQLVQDNYDLNALAPIANYFDTATDFSECGIRVNLHNSEANTFVVYYVPDIETIRQNITSNIESDWWEWNGNQSTWISYNDIIGYNLTIDAGAGAITIEQKNRDFNSPPVTEGSLTALGFGFDDAGTCGVYEDRDPHYRSVAIARPEWGEFTEDWNIEFTDTDIKGYRLWITYHANEGKYQVSLEKEGVGCSYHSYPATDENGLEEPDLDTVHRMFNDAFGTKDNELYYVPLERFEQFVQEHFGMSIDELYAAPKQ